MPNIINTNRLFYSAIVFNFSSIFSAAIAFKITKRASSTQQSEYSKPFVISLLSKLDAARSAEWLAGSVVRYPNYRKGKDQHGSSMQGVKMDDGVNENALVLQCVVL